MRRDWKRICIIGSLCVVAVAAGSLFALLRTPSWYSPPVIAQADRQKVRNNLIAAEQAFTENLRARRGPFIYHIYQDDLNRWITMRREIYPLLDELIPPKLTDPFVIFDADLITIAGRYETAAGNVVLSVDIVPAMEGDTLRLRVDGARCGSVRIPLSFGGIDLDRPIQREREGTWPGSPKIWGDFADGLYLESRAWWKNGGIDYRVLDVELKPGKLCLRVEPLGLHWAKGKSSHD